MIFLCINSKIIRMELSLWITCSSCWKIQALLDAADAGEIIEAFFKGNKGYFIASHSSCSSNPYLLWKQKGRTNKGSVIVNDKPSWACHGKAELLAEGPCACNLTTGMGRGRTNLLPMCALLWNFFLVPSDNCNIHLQANRAPFSILVLVNDAALRVIYLFVHKRNPASANSGSTLPCSHRLSILTQKVCLPAHSPRLFLVPVSEFQNAK